MKNRILRYAKKFLLIELTGILALAKVYIGSELLELALQIIHSL